MKRLTYLTILISFSSFCQNDILVDPRDDQEYRIKKMNGLKWMLDDLNYFTDYSFDLSMEDQEKYDVPEARWYHLTEINTVCPEGWRLPTGDEWLAYIKTLADAKGAKYSEGTYKSDYAIWKFKDYIDIYGSDNPLDLQVMGIYESEQFIQSPGSADYWIQDIPTIKEVGKKAAYELSKKLTPTDHMCICIQIEPTFTRTCITWI